MKKTTKILTVVLAVAILFSVFGISAFAWDNDPEPSEVHKVVCFNNDIFDIHSTISISNGYAYVECLVSFYDPYLDPFDETDPLYPNYSPSNETYSVNISIMVVFQIYNEDMTTEWKNGGGLLSIYNSTSPIAYEPYQLESMTPYQYVSTENFVTITSQSGSTYEVLLNSVEYFWNLY